MKNKIDLKTVALAAVYWPMCITAGLMNGTAAALICNGIDVVKFPKILKPVVFLAAASFGVWQSIKFFDISKEVVDFGEEVVNYVKESFNEDACCDGDCDHCEESAKEEENTIKGQIGFRI